MLPIIFALITYVGWASGDIFTTVGSRKIGAYSMAFWTCVFGFLISLPYIPFALGNIKNSTPEILLFNIGLSAIFAISWFTFNKALEISNPTIVGTICSGFAPLVVVFSIVFLGEKITSTQTAVIILVLIGLILTTLDVKVFKKDFKLDKGVLLSILTMFLWGVYYTFVKIPIREIGWYWPFIISLTMTVGLYFIFLKIKKVRLTNPFSKGALGPILGSAVLTTAGTFSFAVSLGIGISAIVAPIAGSYPTLFVLLSYLVFRERVTKQQIFGILLTLAGIVALAFSIGA